MAAARIDVASQKMAAEKADLLVAVVESSNDAIITKNSDGTITSWNRGAEVLYGYSAADAVGRNISLIVPPELRHELPDILGGIKRGDRIDHYETVGLRKDGTTWSSGRGNVLFYPGRRRQSRHRRYPWK